MPPRSISPPCMVGDFTLPDGRAGPAGLPAAWRNATSAPEYAPEAVAERCGIDGRRASAASPPRSPTSPSTRRSRWTSPGPMSGAAGTRRWSAARSPSTPCAASPRIPTASIPAARCTCCRCCSARSIPRAPGATSRPSRGRSRPGPGPAGKGAKPNTPLAGNILSFPHGPDDLLVDDDGNPLRIDKAFSWDAPLALHGMMHTVIGNAGIGDPYKIDTLFMFMANMAWNSAMNPGEVIRILTEQRPDGEYIIPHVIYSDAFYSRDGALCRPDPAGHHLPRTLGLHLASSTGRSAARMAPAMPSASRCSTPDRDVRPFQDVLIELGARLGLPAFVKPDGCAALQGLPRLHRQPRAHARASARWPASAARTARRRASASRTRTSCSATSTTAASGATTCRRSSPTSSTPTRPISTRPRPWG